MCSFKSAMREGICCCYGYYKAGKVEALHLYDSKVLGPAFVRSYTKERCDVAADSVLKTPLVFGLGVKGLLFFQKYLHETALSTVLSPIG